MNFETYLNLVFPNGLSPYEALEHLLNVGVYIVGIGVYAVFIFHFYRFLASRDMFKLDLSGSEASRHPFFKGGAAGSYVCGQVHRHFSHLCLLLVCGPHPDSGLPVQGPGILAGTARSPGHGQRHPRGGLLSRRPVPRLVQDSALCRPGHLHH